MHVPRGPPRTAPDQPASDVLELLALLVIGAAAEPAMPGSRLDLVGLAALVAACGGILKLLIDARRGRDAAAAEEPAADRAAERLEQALSRETELEAQVNIYRARFNEEERVNRELRRDHEDEMSRARAREQALRARLDRQDGP